MWKCCSRTSFQPRKFHPTPSIKPQMSLLLTPGSSFGLEAGQVQGLQVYKVQPNRQRKLNSDRQKGISWPQLDWNTNALFWECPEPMHYFFTSSPSSGHFLKEVHQEAELALSSPLCGGGGKGQVASNNSVHLGRVPLSPPKFLTIRCKFDYWKELQQDRSAHLIPETPASWPSQPEQSPGGWTIRDVIFSMSSCCRARKGLKQEDRKIQAGRGSAITM